MNKKFYVTTAIDYTNDVIHIGHSYQKILADVLARYHRLLGEKTYFLTGTDEHGQKVEKSANEKGINPQKFVDQIAATDKSEWDQLNISYDRFIRTTDTDHIKFAQEIYLKSKANGDIYLGEYNGLYCEGCEGYLNESDLVDGKCPFHPNRQPLKIKEKNYFFRLSKYQKFLEDLIENNKKFVVPESKRKEVLNFVKSGLKDFAVSRPTIKWGISVPDDPKQTIYVWFDALINYLTFGVEKNCWPADVHILGKDNQRFHAIYWPAMLKSVGYELPKTILVHDFISLNGQKISKSLGNIIRPSELVKQFGVDAVRYFFIRYGPLNNDVDVSLEKIQEVYNADLANGLGNLVARVAKLCENNRLDFKLIDLSIFRSTGPNRILEKIKPLLDEFKFNEALGYIWKCIKSLDGYLDKERPWRSTASDAKKKLGEIIVGSEAVVSLREIANALTPFLPETAEKIEKQFAGPKIKSEKPLFPRLEKSPQSSQSPKSPQSLQNQIVIGKIISLEPHPSAEKLQVVKVDIGQQKKLNIVCSASNLKRGQIVPIALPGAQVNQPQGGKLKVKKTNIRGVKSEAMLCSGLELRINRNHEEIFILPKELTIKIGQPLTSKNLK